MQSTQTGEQTALRHPAVPSHLGGEENLLLKTLKHL